MIKRFQGEEGRRRLIQILKEQRIINGNEKIANAIAVSGKLIDLNAGDAYIEQEGTDNSMFFIISGSSEVIINGRQVAIRDSGTHVGEMALIDYSATRSATVRTQNNSILLELSEENFTPLANQYPEMWRFLASELANRLRQRGGRIKAPNDYPEIFIASSSEQLDMANTIQGAFSHNDAAAIVWSNGIFGPSKTPLESLTAQLEKSDFAVVVLGSEDTINSRDETISAPRDNVIFELGLFIGKLGKERVFIVKERGVKIKIPTDLLGINILEYSQTGSNLDAKLGYVCTEIRKVVANLGTL